MKKKSVDGELWESPICPYCNKINSNHNVDRQYLGVKKRCESCGKKYIRNSYIVYITDKIKENC